MDPRSGDTLDLMTMTLDLPAEAQAKLETEAARRGITLDQLVTELAAGLPADAPRRKLAFVGAGASKSGITHQIDELLADGFGSD